MDTSEDCGRNFSSLYTCGFFMAVEWSVHDFAAAFRVEERLRECLINWYETLFQCHSGPCVFKVRRPHAIAVWKILMAFFKAITLDLAGRRGLMEDAHLQRNQSGRMLCARPFDPSAHVDALVCFIVLWARPQSRRFFSMFAIHSIGSSSVNT
eukprot:6205560-Pleurochrysis_carterae.AAC.1